MKLEDFEAAVDAVALPGPIKSKVSFRTSRETENSIVLCSEEGIVLARISKKNLPATASKNRDPRRKWHSWSNLGKPSAVLAPGNGSQVALPEYSKESLWFYKKLEELGYKYYPEPSVDDIVVLFLRTHQVNALPPEGSMDLGLGFTAFFAAVGPGSYATGQHLHAQKKSVEIQEWSSWKQWALSHRDWLEFRSDVLSTHHRLCQPFIDFTGSDEGSLVCRQLIERREKHRLALAKRRAGLVILFATGVSIAFLSWPKHRQFINYALNGFSNPESGYPSTGP